MREADTIYALSSGRPPAAVSIIRVSGPLAHHAGMMLAGDLPTPRTASLRMLRDPDTSDILDQALVLKFGAPASATGEDAVELQCHGGRAVIDAILLALGRMSGLRMAEPGEFTRRAFANGRIDLTEAEGLADLLEAETESQRKAALAMAGGSLRRQIDLWQQRVLAISAAVERAIDYDDDDDATDLFWIGDCTEFAAEIDQWLARPRVEPLKNGVLVVVAGPPNVGKSSLVNALAGEEKSIVTDIPGTTRDHIEVPLSVGGVPIRLTDTAGLRETVDPVEAIGVSRAHRLTDLADILIWLGEPRTAPSHRRLLKVHSKADLGDRKDVPEGSIAISATTGKGLATLLARVSTLATHMMPAGDEVALNRRQVDCLATVKEALEDACRTTELILAAERLRSARLAFDRLTGRAGIEDFFDQLFRRFCLGK